MKRDFRRGILLATALFVTLVLYLLVLALLYQAHENIRLTSTSHRRVQAHFVARGAAQIGLSRLNADPGWLDTHKAPAGSEGVPPQAETVMIGDQKASVWVEAADNPAYYTLVGHSSLGGIQRRLQMTVAREPVTPPLMAAATLGSGVFTIDPRGGGGWQPKPAPARFTWVPGGAGLVPVLAPPPPPGPDPVGEENHKGEAVAGQPDSALFLATRVLGNSAVLMLPAGSSQWSLLPPVVLRSGSQAVGIRQLVSTPNKLYALARNPAGEHEIFFLNDPASAQTTYDPVAGRFTVSPGRWQPVPLPAGLTQGQDIAESQNGLLYLQADGQRYQSQPDGSWTALPELPETYWAPGPSGFEVHTLSVDGGSIQPRGMMADPHGNLYVNRQVNDYSTFYKYVPASEGRTGYYRMLPPFSQRGRADDVTHDFGGYLYVRLAVESAADTVLYGDVDTPGRTLSYQALPALPSSYGTVDAIGSVGSPAPTVTRFRPIYIQ